MRTDGRMPEDVRPVTIQRDYSCYAHGSVMIEMGKTRIICTAMVEDRAPQHALAKNMGWLSCEYCMLPSANEQRRSMQRAANGRSQEIQRLIGRALRACVDLHRLPGKTIWIDCDVVQADGGTRTASVTGSFVALVDALWALREQGKVDCIPLLHGLAAVSVGIVDGMPAVDLCADEDRAASVDMNVVMTHDGRFVEVQGTAEGTPFSGEERDRMLALAEGGMRGIIEVQKKALGDRLRL